MLNWDSYWTGMPKGFSSAANRVIFFFEDCQRESPTLGENGPEIAGQLLIEFHKHPFLQGKLVLKGGAAINLFYLDLL